MRGKRYEDNAMQADGRLIPAHAGKTKKLKIRLKSPKAHPRACGENWSVRVRLMRRAWLIPAHAGKTVFDQIERIEDGGSSPRMRGKRSLYAIICLLSWLIPAHAGKTQTADPSS